MAGSLGYSIKVAHVYQRQFDSKSLDVALADSHLYLISRRPAVRIDKSSVRLYEGRITFDIVTRKSVRSMPESHSLMLNFEPGIEIEDFRTYSNNAYFSFRANRILVHGDAWTLASLASNARDDLATQEVLYVGQAYGRDGSGNSWRRTRRHSTLQKIYEDHSEEDWDIFVSSLVVVGAFRSTEDHIDDIKGSTPAILRTHGKDPFYDKRRKEVLPTSIDLIEHALIFYFSAPYNELLKEWRIDRPTVAIGKMKSAGLRLLQIYLDGWQSLARYYSRETEQSRGHLVLLAVETDSNSDNPRVNYDPNIHNWRLAFRISSYKELLSAAETSNVALNIFGDQAPRIRRPPEVLLPDEKPPWSLDGATKSYSTLVKQTTVYQGPTLDATTGLISVGEYADGQRCHWRLFRPGKGACHGVIAGGRGTGKTNMLDLLRVEALSSGLFCLVVSDPTGRHDFSVWQGCAYGYTDSIESAIELLRATARIITSRQEMGDYELSPGTPGS